MEIRLILIILGILGIVDIIYSYSQRKGTIGFIRTCKEEDIGKAWLFTMSCFGLLVLTYLI